MTFDEAIAAATENPGLRLTGITLDKHGEWLTVYFLSSAEEGGVALSSKRAQLFTSQREVSSYSIDSAPAEAMLVEYTDHAAQIGHAGISEHSLHALFPELPKPEDSVLDDFKVLAVQAAEESGFVTVV